MTHLNFKLKMLNKNVFCLLRNKKPLLRNILTKQQTQFTLAVYLRTVKLNNKQ